MSRQSGKLVHVDKTRDQQIPQKNFSFQLQHHPKELQQNIQFRDQIGNQSMPAQDQSLFLKQHLANLQEQKDRRMAPRDRSNDLTQMLVKSPNGHGFGNSPGHQSNISHLSRLSHLSQVSQLSKGSRGSYLTKNTKINNFRNLLRKDQMQLANFENQKGHYS